MLKCFAYLDLWVHFWILLLKSRPTELILFSNCCLIEFNSLDSRATLNTVWILISWLLQKPADLDLHSFQKTIYIVSVGQGFISLSYLFLNDIVPYVLMRRLLNYEASHHELHCLEKYPEYRDRLQQSGRSSVAIVTINSILMVVFFILLQQ